MAQYSTGLGSPSRPDCGLTIKLVDEQNTQRPRLDAHLNFLPAGFNHNQEEYSSVLWRTIGKAACKKKYNRKKFSKNFVSGAALFFLIGRKSQTCFAYLSRFPSPADSLHSCLRFFTSAASSPLLSSPPHFPLPSPSPSTTLSLRPFGFHLFIYSFIFIFMIYHIGSSS
jgi:hypothetical protein